MGCSVEVLVLYAKELDEVEELIIEIPNELIAQFERTFGHNTENNGMFLYLATQLLHEGKKHFFSIIMRRDHV